MRFLLFIVFCIVGVVGFYYAMVGTISWDRYCYSNGSSSFCGWSIWTQFIGGLIVVCVVVTLISFSWTHLTEWFDRKGW